MEVKLLHSTPLWVADLAISKCYDKKCNRDEIDIKKIENVVNVNKHESTIEHIVFNFEVNGVSRALLQELAKYRIASLSVNNTRYTLKELRDELPFDQSTILGAKKHVVLTEDDKVIIEIKKAFENLRLLIKNETLNDIDTFALPDACKTNLVWTINARSLKIFLKLKTLPYAMWEIREFAYEIYDKIPTSYKFLFEKEIHSKG